MADEDYTFTQARARLEEIVSQVRRKDVSLEKSLDLLEEGVRLANSCTERIDHTEWRTVAEQSAAHDSQAQGETSPDADTSDPSGPDEAEEVAVFEIACDESVVVEVAEIEVAVTADDSGSEPFGDDERDDAS